MSTETPIDQPAPGETKQLTVPEVLAIIQRQADEVGRMCNWLADVGKGNAGSVDGRWLAIATTNLQQGFMAAQRAVHQQPGF